MELRGIIWRVQLENLSSLYYIYQHLLYIKSFVTRDSLNIFNEKFSLRKHVENRIWHVALADMKSDIKSS